MAIMKDTAFRFIVLLGVGMIGCADYDVIIRGGHVYDGTGGAPTVADIGIQADTITIIGNLSGKSASTDIDAHGLAVSPGFINMLSWATESLVADGRAKSDLMQGVTLEVFGEGWSEGPINDSMRKEALEQQTDIKFDIAWTTLGDYMRWLENRGVSPNIASFVGAATVRIYVLGYVDRAPNPAELDSMRSLVRAAMEEGALGVGSALIYAPAFYARTDELIALSRVAAAYDGLYISHMRSEANRLLESIDEVLEISRQAGIRGEVYHLKAAGRANWSKMDSAISKIERARLEGLDVAANMYTYTAGATGLDAAMPPWVQEGGLKEWIKRLQDPDIRQKVALDMRTPTDAWENFFLAAGSPDHIILTGFRNDTLKYLTGKTLAEVSSLRGTSPEECAMDLVIQDESRVGTVYFLMSEENVRKQIALPWVSFGSDGGAPAAEGFFLKYKNHPRAYGNFARLLGKYVREEKIIPLQEAIRRLTSWPASRLHIARRGSLKVGHYADIVVFDPQTIRDHATFENPHQYATGVKHVFVNGVAVVKDEEHTERKPGRFVKREGTGNR